MNRSAASGSRKKPSAKFRKRDETSEELIAGYTFERLKRSNQLKKLKNGIFYIVTALTVCVIFFAICVEVFLKVTDVTVVGSKMYRAEELSQNCGIEHETNIYSVSRAKIERDMVMKYPYISTVKLKRILPSTVELSVTEDTPYFYTEISGEYFVLSDDLRVLQRTENIADLRYSFGLRELVTPEVAYAVVGRQIRFKRESNYDYALNFIRWLQLSELYEKTDKIDISDKYMMFIIYDEKLKIVLGDDDELEVKLSSAIKILEQLDDIMSDTNGIIDVQDINMGFAIPGGDIT